LIYVLWLALIAIGAYEAWAIVQESKVPTLTGLTISEKVWTVTVHHPLVPFLFGMLMGHFFWQAAT
jgi:hypothetical protein